MRRVEALLRNSREAFDCALGCVIPGFRAAGHGMATPMPRIHGVLIAYAGSVAVAIA